MKSTPVTEDAVHSALKVTLPPDAMRGVVWVTPSLVASVPDSRARKLPLLVPSVVRKNPPTLPLVAVIDTVSVMGAPTAGLRGLAVNVTVGAFPPRWQPSHPGAAMPARRANATEGIRATLSTRAARPP